MGVSTNGILTYGYDLGGPEHWFLEGIEYEELQGTVPWWPKATDEEEEEEEGFADAVVKALCPVFGFEVPKWSWMVEQKLPVQVITHCSLDYPMYILSAGLTTHTSYQGRARLLNMASLAVQEEWAKNLQKALDALDIKPIQQEPGWILASLWG